MEDVKLSLRTHRSRISSIIKDGFKNSFDVEPTAWWMTQNVDDYVAQRKAAEFHAFNVPFEAGAESRPVYGFARMSDDFTTAVGGQTSYGDVLINIKKREDLKVIASAGQERISIGDTIKLTERVESGGQFVSDPTTGRIITHTLPLRESLEQRRIVSTGVLGSVNLNIADRIGPSAGSQQFENLPIPQKKMPEFLKQVSSLVQGNANVTADNYVELSLFDRLKAGDIESIDIVRRPFDIGNLETRDAPEALKGGLHSVTGEEASVNMLQAAQEDINLASSLRSQLDEMGLSHIPIRTGATVPIHGVNSGNQNLMSKLESLSGFKHKAGMIGERTVFDTAEKTAEQLMGIDQLFSSEEFKKMPSSMIPSRAFAAKNIESGTGVFSSLIDSSVKEVEQVVNSLNNAGGMPKRTLGGIIEAGETAAKVMRFRV